MADSPCRRCLSADKGDRPRNANEMAVAVALLRADTDLSEAAAPNQRTTASPKDQWVLPSCPIPAVGWTASGWPMAIGSSSTTTLTPAASYFVAGGKSVEHAAFYEAWIRAGG